MKAVAISRCTEHKEHHISYPCLMISNLDELVVLFISEGVGTAVNGASQSQVLGTYSSSWVMGSFTPYNGTVTITNEVEVEDIWYEF